MVKYAIDVIKCSEVSREIPYNLLRVSSACLLLCPLLTYFLDGDIGEEEMAGVTGDVEYASGANGDSWRKLGKL